MFLPFETLVSVFFFAFEEKVNWEAKCFIYFASNDVFECHQETKTILCTVEQKRHWWCTNYMSTFSSRVHLNPKTGLPQFNR